MTLLVVDRLAVRFGGVSALVGVSFTVGRGERVALVGPNGAGKTTVLNCISGVVAPERGTVVLDGRDVTRMPPWARAQLGVARTLQGLGLVGPLDVAGNLLLGRHHRGRAGMVASALRLPRAREEAAADRRRVGEIAQDLALDAELAVPARTLPAGARKRLELGRALAMDPVLLLLDEPFAGADPADVALMVAAIRRAADAGTGVIVVDHDREAVLGLTERVVALEAGRLVDVSAA